MKRDQWLKKCRRRWARVVRLRDKGLTFVEIGEIMDVTRQRASQMYYSGIKENE